MRASTAEAAFLRLAVELLPKSDRLLLSTSTKGPPLGPTVMLVMLPLPLPELLMVIRPEE